MELFDSKIQAKKARNRFFWRLFGLIIYFLFLTLDLVFIIQSNEFLPYPFALASDRLSFYYAYFTTQTNYMVLIYLFALLFEQKIKKNNEPINFFILLAITVYITITMLVFWLGLFTNAKTRAQYNHPYNLVKTLIMHLLMPIIMITSFVITSGHKKYSLKEHHKLYLWFIMFYPASYLVYVLVRGGIRWNEKFGEASYPYPFLNYHENGVGFLVGSIIGILILVVGLQYFYMWINNLRYTKKHPKDTNKSKTPKITYTYKKG